MEQEIAEKPEKEEHNEPKTDEEVPNEETKPEEKPKTGDFEFKKPILIGRIGKPLKKLTNIVENKAPIDKTETQNSQPSEEAPKPPGEQQPKVPLAPKPYKEPSWSGVPPDGFYFEVLKSGVILQNIKLEDKAYFTCGKLASNDIVMEHPTISRYHAIIQYRATSEDEKFPVGFYIYDLGSSHGTFVNKVKTKPHHYARIKVGHLVKVGCSTRQYILQGPDEDDADKESELGLTEMKELKKIKMMEIQQRIAEELERKKALEEAEKKKEEEDGIDWGMAEDAEEESDLAENPFAQTTNEELYLDDPKKTLRGFFEREGETLEYDCQEKGAGQFVCRVELPVEDSRGKPVVAEVIHRGKKKEAVVQCALEACRILDRCGVLRQSHHESRQKKSKNWADNDYYDSDDDSFFDRTGSIEKKRQTRMQRFKEIAESEPEKNSNKALTYDDLVEQCNQLNKQIASSETRLASLREKSRSSKQSDESNEDSDALDAFMKDLNKRGPSVADKAEISKLKVEITTLKGQLAKAQRLAEIAKPTSLPALITEPPKTPVVKKTNTSIIIGKRIKVQSRQQTPYKKQKEEENNQNEKFEEEVESDEEELQTAKKEQPKEEVKKIEKEEIKKIEKTPEKQNAKPKEVKNYGPMRPPSNYVMPENYFEQINDRDLPEITDEEY